MSKTILSIRKISDTKAVIIFEPEEKLVLPIDIIYKFTLRKNDEVDDAVFEELVHAATHMEILNSAFRYLGIRMHTTRELEDKLRKKKFPKEIITEVLHYLTEQKLLNDEAFARLYIVHAYFDKRHGGKKIVASLQKRGVDYRLSQRLIDEIITPEEKLAPLLSIANKKAVLLKKRNYTAVQVKQKLIAFLMSRGFDYESIKSALREMDLPEEEESQ